MTSPRRDEVWLVSLDPTQGSEIQKTRPCLIVSPNEANDYLRTERPYPTRVSITYQRKRGQVALDRIRAVDRQRLVRKLGTATGKAVTAVTGPEMVRNACRAIMKVV